METNNLSDSKEAKNITNWKKILGIGCGCLVLVVFFILISFTLLSKFIVLNFPMVVNMLSQKLGFSLENSGQGFSITDKDTKLSFNAGNNKIPSSFPTDVPIPEGVKVTSTLSTDEAQSEDSHWLTLSTEVPYDQVTQFYVSKLKENGWTIDNTVAVEDGTTLTFKKNSRVGSISIGQQKDNQETTIVIILGNESNNDTDAVDSTYQQDEAPYLDSDGSM